MEDTSGPQLKRERLGSYSHPQATLPHHMPSGEAPGLHNYHPPAPQQPAGSMPPSWNPTPSPYHEGSEHRHPASEPPPPHHQPPYPPQNYPPQHPPPGQVPSYPSDPAYSRQGSSSGPTRSPPVAQNPHYPPVNGAPHDSSYYHPQEYRARPAYGPPESPANGTHPPALHVSTNNEIMPGQPSGQPPPQYGPPPHSAGPYAPPHWGPPPENWFANQRRKPVRAAQACENCRSRKAKCDEGRPSCSHCKDNGLTCSYRDVPPQKAEKQVIAITERLESLSEDVKQMTSAWKMQEDKINRILNMQETQASQLREFTATALEERKPTHAIAMTKSSSRNRTKEEQPTDSGYYQNPSSSFHQTSDSTNETHQYLNTTQPENGAKVRVPMSASDLLLWPAVREITPTDQSSTYVMDTEISRGLLRLYGAGEGDDKADGHDPPCSPANSSSSGRPLDDEGSNSSPSMIWGTGSTYRPGNGDSLGLQSKAIDDNVKSYMDHMHILHPFLDPRVLRNMVRKFKEKHSVDYVQHLSRMTQNVGTKRKREMSDSPNAMVDDRASPASVPHPDRKRPVLAIEHSISNAIVLLVIALGKICAHRQPLPAATKLSSQGTPGKTLTPNPALGYPDLPPTFTQSAPTSPHGSSVYPNGTGTSIPHSDFPQSRLNIEVIPGLPYFAKAADILGEHAGGSDVSHVQANLLAGLYMSQLARIISSHWYIANACRACMILINASDYRNRKMSAKRRNLINFAFWSCLQLESDILAEMDIPASGIIAKEASMLREIPNDLTIIDDDQEKESSRSDPHDCIRHYSNQIQLRRTLNDAVTNIYDAQRQQPQARPTKLVETIGQNLEGWRSLLRDDWAWSDSEHQSKDINHARMRGKYYGAKYIINRPALHYALSCSWPSTPGSRPSESPVGGPYSEYTSPAMGHFGASVTNRRFSEMQPPARSDPLDSWILDACKRCVDAAILSTTCFDAVEPQRIIITNIFGTSHAQFGNVLVLAATYNSPNPELKSLVDRKILCTLITRTIEWLSRNRDISPALKEDAKILQYVQKKLNLFTDGSNQAKTYPQPSSASSSFTSAHY